MRIPPDQAADDKDSILGKVPLFPAFLSAAAIAGVKNRTRLRKCRSGNA